MQTRAIRKYLKIFFSLVLAGLGLGLIAGFTAWLLLPGLLVNRYLPGLADELGFVVSEIEVRRIGWRGLDLGRLELAGPDGQLLELDSLRFDYTPWSLWRERRIERLVVGGFRTALLVGDGEVRPRGGWPPGLLQLLRAARPEPAKPPLFYLAKLEFRHSEIELELEAWQDRLHIPFKLQTGPLFTDMRKLRIDLELQPRGAVVPVHMELEFSRPSVQAELNLSRFAFSRFEDSSLRALLPFDLQEAIVSLKLQAELSFQPVTLEKLEASAVLHRLQAGVPGLGRIATWSRPELSGEPEFHLDFNGRQARLTMARLSLRTDQWLLEDGGGWCEIASISGSFDGWQALGEAELAVFDRSRNMALPRLALETSADYRKASDWQFQIHGQIPELTVARPGINLFGQDHHWRLAGGAGSPLEFRLETGPWQLMAGEGRVSVDRGRAVASWGGDTGDWTVQFPSARFHSEDRQLELNELSLNGTAAGPPGGGLPWWEGGRWQAFLGAESGTVQDAEYDLAGQIVELGIPLQWPWPESIAEDFAGLTDNPREAGRDQPGEVRLEALRWGQQRLGQARLMIGQGGNGFSVAGQFVGDAQRLPDLQVELEAEVDLLNQAPIKFGGRAVIDDWRLRQPQNLGWLLPAAAGVWLSGAVDLELQVGWPPLPAGTVAVTAELRDAVVDMPDRRLRFEGVKAKLEFADGLANPSSGRQNLSFETAGIGELRLSRGIVDFRVDGPGKLFVEQAKTGWAGGRLSVFSLPLAPATESFVFNIFCENLELAGMMRELNLGKATGEGRINGRIPVDYRDGRLRIDDGFLYSTPGLGGTISMGGQALLDSMVDGEAGGQLALTRAALRDFNYEWARLKLTMDEGRLLASLQLDGAPAAPLPFVYREEIGDWVRVAGEGSTFEGIRLDLNFSLPLDRVLGIGVGLHELFQTGG